MKKALMLLVMTLLPVISTGVAAPGVDSVEWTNAIAIVTTGEIDAGLVRRVADFVGGQFRCPVRLGYSRLRFNLDPDMGLEKLATRMQPGDICLLVLAGRQGRPLKQRGGTSKPLRAAWLNVQLLEPDRKAMNPENAYELYARRVEKESVRLVGELIGLKICPCPQCAMYLPQTESELDTKSRTLCPPCMGRAWDVLVAKGVRLRRRQELISESRKQDD